MKVKFIKKMLAVLCVATMSMSCITGSVGAIEFVKRFKGVDVEGTQKYAEKLNKSIQNLKKKLYDCKDLIELKLGEKQLDEKRRDQLEKQLKLRDEQIKNQQLEKQRLKEKEDAFRSKESLLNNRLCELQQEQNQIYEEKFHLEEIRSKQDIIKEKTDLEKRQNDFNLKFREFENELQKYGYNVSVSLCSDMDEGNSVTYRIVRQRECLKKSIKIMTVALEGYDVVEQNPQQIELLKSLKPQIDKWMDLIEKLDKVQFVKAIQLNDDLHLQLDMKADVTISGVINMIKESRLYEGVNKIFEDNYNDLFYTINIYLDEYVILSGNNDTNFNLRERERLEREKKEREDRERLEREKREKEEKEKLERQKLENDKKEKKIIKRIVKKKVRKSKKVDENIVQRKEIEEKERLEREKKEKERLEREKREKEEKERLERQKLENDKKEKKIIKRIVKKKVVKKKVVKKKVVKKKVVKKKVVKKKSLNEHNKTLDNILNQIEVLSNEIQQAEKSKVSYIKNYRRNLSTINHTINDVRAKLKEIKGVVYSKDFATYQAEVNKTVEQKRAEKSKLKDEMEKDIANLEKQIQDKNFKKADLEKQFKSMMK